MGKEFVWMCKEFLGMCTEFIGTCTELIGMYTEFVWMCTEFIGMCTETIGMYTEFNGMCTEFSGMCTEFTRMCTEFIGMCFKTYVDGRPARQETPQTRPDVRTGPQKASRGAYVLDKSSEAKSVGELGGREAEGDRPKQVVKATIVASCLIAILLRTIAKSTRAVSLQTRRKRAVSPKWGP